MFDCGKGICNLYYIVYMVGYGCCFISGILNGWCDCFVVVYFVVRYNNVCIILG